MSPACSRGYCDASPVSRRLTPFAHTTRSAPSCSGVPIRPTASASRFGRHDVFVGRALTISTSNATVVVLFVRWPQRAQVGVLGVTCEPRRPDFRASTSALAVLSSKRVASHPGVGVLALEALMRSALRMA